MAKQLISLLGNSQALDGGAMFGNVPKAMWDKWVEVDQQNRIRLHCRALLVKEEKRNILFETGIGAFFEPKLKQRFGVVESEHVLLNSLAEVGLSHEDIDLVVLSPMHFDHAGGLLSQWQEGKPHELLFPNAQFVTGKSHWQRAIQPHFRDRASFIPELNQLLLDSGRLHLVEPGNSSILGDGYRFIESNGHTPGMLISEINTDRGWVRFVADLIPGTPWVHLPVTMGYDRYPESLIEEKQALLEQVHSDQGWLYYTHDVKTAISQVEKDERGRFKPINLLASLPTE